MRFRIIRFLPGVLIFVLCALSAPGLSLLERSPFVWPGFEANANPLRTQAPAATPSDLEFHAVYELSGRTHILVKDRRKNEFYWLSLGEETDGMLPKQYNREKDELLLAYDNQEKWLALQNLPQASGTPQAAAAQAARIGTSPNEQTRPRRRVIRPSTGSSAVRQSSIRRNSRIPPIPSMSRTARVRAEDIGLVEPTTAPTNLNLSPPETSPPSDLPEPPPSNVPPRRP